MSQSNSDSGRPAPTWGGFSFIDGVGGDAVAVGSSYVLLVAQW